MKIYPITQPINSYKRQKYSSKNNNQNNKDSIKNISYFPVCYNDISFGKSLNYKDFLISMRKVYKNKSLKNVILSTINDEKNYIGSGFSANAYDIPGIPDYIIRIERNKFTPQNFIHSAIKEEKQNVLAPNFGQYIATNEQGFYINKKVIGESHSLPNWSNTIQKIQAGEEIKHRDAKLFLNKLENLSEFPQTSFDEIAKNINLLNKYTKSEIDIINPNNLIIDNKTKHIGIIDLWYRHIDNGSHEPYNGTDSLINLMLDPFIHKKVYNKLSNSDKDKFIEYSTRIIDKVLDAGKNNGLSRTKNNAMQIYKDFDNTRSKPFAVPAYNDFLEMYSDIL